LDRQGKRVREGGETKKEFVLGGKKKSEKKRVDLSSRSSLRREKREEK